MDVGKIEAMAPSGQDLGVIEATKEVMRGRSPCGGGRAREDLRGKIFSSSLFCKIVHREQVDSKDISNLQLLTLSHVHVENVHRDSGGHKLIFRDFLKRFQSSESF